MVKVNPSAEANAATAHVAIPSRNIPNRGIPNPSIANSFQDRFQKQRRKPAGDKIACPTSNNLLDAGPAIFFPIHHVQANSSFQWFRA
jgi:hypothetical protein